tara:strand:+ start:225 stop:407 length:183 start_codon:yes stop_codon:yes gene_type:complete
MNKIIGISIVTLGLASCTSSKFTYEAPNDYEYYETEAIHENLTEEEYYELIAQEYEVKNK